MIDLRPSTNIEHIVYTSIGDYLPFPQNILFPLVAKKKKLAAKVKDAENLHRWKEVLKSHEAKPPSVDMSFDDEPERLRRGQTLQLRLTLGDNSDAILIPNGSFYQDTGGNWVFVVAPDGSEAIRRTVRLGRRNTDFIEVLDGLEPGERVITSPYSSFVGMDRLSLNDD
jgi:hypothetical protein